MEIGKIFHKIFGEPIVQNPEENNSTESFRSTKVSEVVIPDSITHLGYWLDGKLEKVESQYVKPTPLPGRVGPEKVIFSVHPEIPVRPSVDKLTLQSLGTFVTVKGNVCVFNGKWMYELQLRSKGVMQLGWCSNRCIFSTETGVGDTKNSYGFDGSKKQIWHVYTTKYGDRWHSGDIIGVCLDLDNEKIEFFRNGTSMGVAFSSIVKGPGLVLYPAVSLAYNESIRANFGGSPFRFPIDGYEPLEVKPELDLLKADFLLTHVVNLAGILSKPRNRKDRPDKKVKVKKTVYNLVASSLVERIVPHLVLPYVVEDKLLIYMKNLCHLRSETDQDKVIMPGSLESTLGTLLTILWTYMEQDEVAHVMKMLLNTLLSMFNQTPTDLEYERQRKVIVILSCLCNHPRTRKFYVEFKFFKENCLPHFLYLRPPEYSVMVKLLPDEIIWTKGIGGCKEKYLEACEKLNKSVEILYGLQKNLLENLLNNVDGNALEPSTRKIFLARLRKYTMDNSLEHRAFFILQGTQTYPLETPVALSFFSILVDITKDIFTQERPDANVVVNLKNFVDGSLRYQHFDRVGGVLTHLRKVHRNDIEQNFGEDVTEGTNGTDDVDIMRAEQADVFSILGRRRGQEGERMTELNLKPGNMEVEKSTEELLDLCVVYYYAAAHKHVVKIAAVRDEIESLNNLLLETKQQKEEVEKYLRASRKSTGVKDEIMQELDDKFGERKNVFAKRSIELGRKQAWYRSVALGDHRRSLLIWLLDKNLETLLGSSKAGQLFSFVPEIYINVLPILLDAVLDFSMHDASVQFELKDAELQIRKAAEFLGSHSADLRIILASCKDSLLQAIGMILSHAAGITAMEEAKNESKLLLVKALLRPYENRAWGQSNWLLLRFWLGHGFAYRESRPPSIWQGGEMPFSLGLQRTRTKNESHTGLLHHIAPAYPSKHFQELIGKELTDDEPFATAFLNSVLSQLNWAFSEFILLLQEIHTSSTRQENDTIYEPRQLKVCAMCFELTVSLMRALEMILTIAPEIYKNPTRPNSDLILNRTCQLVSQVLSRVTVPPGSFQFIVDMCLPDLSSVTHFAIISAAVGILLALLREEMENSTQPVKVNRVSRALLTDPSFQIANLEFALGEVKTAIAPQADIPRGNFDPQMRAHIDPLTNDVRAQGPSTSKRIRSDPPIIQFSLRDYPSHVDEKELEDVKNLIDMLREKQSLLSDITLPSEDSLCPICCARPLSATFSPCKHQSCSYCILQHLMNSKLCFFCKTLIREVVQNDGNVVYENQETPEC